MNFRGSFFHFLLPKYKIPRREINEAVKAGFDAYYEYMRAVRLEGKKAIEFARKNAKRIMILAGRHIMLMQKYRMASISSQIRSALSS